MIPPLIVRRARELALGIIAIADHNSAENVAAMVEAARGTELVVLPGMEVQTKEEVHLLCLFDSVEQVQDWQTLVYAHLPALKNKAEYFGGQFVVDATGDLIRCNERLLLTSTSLSVEEVALAVEEREGLCIAAHVDRSAFGLLANLGFVPPGAHLAALEISHFANAEQLQDQHPSVRGFSFISSGDAHRLSELSDRTVLTIQEPTITEISLALKRQEGRRVKVLSPVMPGAQQ